MENHFFYFILFFVTVHTTAGAYTIRQYASYQKFGFYHHQSPQTIETTGIEWFDATESWEGMADQFPAPKLPILLQTGATPRPLKHGWACWQTSRGSCIQAWTCCPCDGKLCCLPLTVCNQLLSPLFRGTVIYRKTCLFAMSVRCLRDGLFALNIERLPFIKMNKYFLTCRGADSQESPPSNLSVSEMHSR